MIRKYNYAYFLFFSLFFISVEVSAQDGEFSSKNPEEQYNIVRQLAQTGSYSEARSLGLKILDSIPGYHDVTLMIARTFMWENKYDSAKVFVQKVLDVSPENHDANEAQYDLAFFSEDWPEVISLAPALIKLYPDRNDIREKYAKALLANDQDALALAHADTILSLDPNNAVAEDIKNSQVHEKNLDITAGYSFDHFSEPYNRWWHLYTAGARKYLPWGSIEGRFNVGHLNSESNNIIATATEWQLEAESYINLTKASNMMLLYAYSPYTHFPNHRAAVEVWHTLPAAMVASVGLSYYYWDNNNIYIGTASLEKYWQKYWFCFRTYIHFKDVGVSGSYYFTARRYINDRDYFQVTLGTGTAPDEPYDIKEDLGRLSAYSARCLLNKGLTQKWTLRAGLGYAREEFRDNVYRNRYDGTISLIYSIWK